MNYQAELRDPQGLLGLSGMVAEMIGYSKSFHGRPHLLAYSGFTTEGVAGGAIIATDYLHYICDLIIMTENMVFD